MALESSDSTHFYFDFPPLTIEPIPADFPTELDQTYIEKGIEYSRPWFLARTVVHPYFNHLAPPPSLALSQKGGTGYKVFFYDNMKKMKNRLVPSPAECQMSRHLLTCSNRTYTFTRPQYSTLIVYWDSGRNSYLGRSLKGSTSRPIRSHFVPERIQSFAYHTLHTMTNRTLSEPYIVLQLALMVGDPSPASWNQSIKSVPSPVVDSLRIDEEKSIFSVFASSRLYFLCAMLENALSYIPI